MTLPRLPRWTCRALLPALAFAGAGPLQATPAEYAQTMLRLATERGCMACHSIGTTPARPDGLPPIAPAWRDIAIKYRDDPAAHERLVRTVMTGSNPAARHWVGKVSAVNMPPHATVVTEREAHELVNWLLVLVP
jgi:cytochrome c